MYDIGPGAAANLGLGRVRFCPAVVIGPPSCAGKFGPPPLKLPQLCRPIWPGPIAKGGGVGSNNQGPTAPLGATRRHRSFRRSLV